MSRASAAENRQTILNYLNAQPIGYLPGSVEILAATGIAKCVANSCITTMCKQREIEKIGKGKATRYRALVKTTISADELKEQADATRRATVGAKSGATRGAYVHVAGHYDGIPGHVQGKPLRNQGGQSSGAKRVFVGGLG